MMKTFVIGDIHGRYKALIEVLKKSKFNYDKDKLIVLGDVVDGGFDTYKVVEELLKIKNLILILGNHDLWFMKNIKSGWAEEIWLQQGGFNTLKSYGATIKEAEYISDNSVIDASELIIPVTHQEFFNKGIYYYIQDRMLFVHAGINPKIHNMESQSKTLMIWDRSLIGWCKEGKWVPKYDKVFIGHTTTQLIMNDTEYTEPVIFSNLYMLDTGAGWTGKLTIMNTDTEKYWQSKIQKPAIRKIKK